MPPSTIGGEGMLFSARLVVHPLSVNTCVTR